MKATTLSPDAAPTLRQILAACGIESTSDRSRLDYHLKRKCKVGARIRGIEVVFLDVDLIELGGVDPESYSADEKIGPTTL